MKKKIIITGGAGFIGRNLCAELLKNDLNEVICLDKTIKSVEYLLNFEEFDYVIRTNMSSVWDLKKIYDLILLNNFNVAAIIGGSNNNPYPSGAGILLKKNICELIVKNKHELNYGVIDDVSIGNLLNKLNIKIESLTRFEAYNYENNIGQINHNEIKNYYHFRCKSQKTIELMKHIIYLIYGV